MASGVQSMSSFLLAYAPDKFEWESPEYCARTRFLWTRPMTTSPAAELEAHPSSLCKSASESLSDMSTSLSDMSISLSDVSILLSDMSISVSNADDSSCTSVDFESFAANVPGEKPIPLSQGSTPDFLFPCVSVDNLVIEEVDVRCSRLFEWTTSLFADVAQSVLKFNITPGDNVFEAESSCASIRDFDYGDEQESFSKATKEEITLESSSTRPVVKFKSSPLSLKSSPRKKPIIANANSIEMPFAVDYNLLNPEQITTAKGVCLWGRRLERIPKVRVAGQTEAVYCFDAQNDYSFARNAPLESLRATAETIKIAQGHVLLQNVNPVRFGAHSSVPAHASSMQLRVPFSLRTNASAGPAASSPRHRSHASSTPGFSGYSRFAV